MGHARQTALDLVGLLPVVGALKYGDEIGTLLKPSLKNAGETITALKSIAKNSGEFISRVVKEFGNVTSGKVVLGTGLGAVQAGLEDLAKAIKNVKAADEAASVAKGTSNLGSARYVERKISDTLYSKLRRKTPNSTIRDVVNENIDELIGTPDPAIPGKLITGNLEADHIVSMKKITKMDGFEKLTEAQQIQILNNPENFIGLTKTANTSKGSKSFMEWVTYKKENIDINPEFRAKMIEKEKELESILQKQIDDLNKLNN